MHLPGPLRAAVGLLASAADEARHLPDRAIELPMLAVSTALQASLRAQQRYARLAARGDQVLHRRPTTDEPPPWATFDEPVPVEDLGRGPNGFGPTGADATRMLDDLFGVSDPSAGVASGDDGQDAEVTDLAEVRKAAADDTDSGADAATDAATSTRTSSAPKTAPTAPATTAGGGQAAKKAPTSKPAASKTGAPKPAAAKAAATAKKAAKKAAPAKAAATKAAATKRAPSGSATDASENKPTAPRSKTINSPRHTAPSAFDSAGDAGDDD